MFAKSIKLFFLFCLFLVVISAFLLQTEFAKEKIKSGAIALLETHTGAHVTITKLDGIVPFYITLNEVKVQYAGEKMAQFDQIKVGLSPLTLITRPLTLHRLRVKKGWIKGIPLSDKTSSWPTLKTGLAVHNISIEDLMIANSIPLDIRGLLELQPESKSGDFSLDLKIATHEDPSPFLSVQLEGNKENATLYAITHLKNPSNLSGSIWITSSTDWDTRNTLGEIIGEGTLPPELHQFGQHLSFRTDFELSPSLDLTLSELVLRSAVLDICGQGDYVLSRDGLSGRMSGNGQLLNRPISFETDLKMKDLSKLSLTHLNFTYLDASLQGKLNILFSDIKDAPPQFVGLLEGQFAHLGPLLTRFDMITTPLYGEASGTLELFLTDDQKQGVIFDLEGRNLKWKELTAELAELSGTFINYEKGTLHAQVDEAKWGEALLEMVEANLILTDQNQILFEISSEGQQIEGSFDTKENLLSINTTLSALQLNRIFPMHLEGGVASGSLFLEGPLDNLNGQMDLDLNQVNFYDCLYEVFPSCDFSLQGSLEKSKLSFQGVATGLGEQPLKADGDIPIVLNLPNFSLDKEAPFSLKVQGKGRIDPLLTFLEGASLICKGSMELDLGITGTMTNPNLDGYLVLTEGFVEDLTTGAIFKDLYVSMVGQGKELHIGTLTARDLESGTLEGNGLLVWDTEENFPFKLDLIANTYNLFTVDPLTAKATGEFTIEGDLQEVLISGQAKIEEAHLSLPDKLPVQVPTLEVTYLNPIEDEVAPADGKRKIALSWDLSIDIPNNFFIEGRGLTSEWEGNMRIVGSVDALTYDGDLKALSGKLNFADRFFTLANGRVKIEGLEPSQIWMNLQAQADFPAVTVLVTLTGTVESPEIKLSSSPPMEANQILSWILFNSNIEELTPFQACRLAHMLVKLSGKYTGPGIFSSIKEGLGLDVFDITHCDIDSADVTFQVGKYISQGVFVGVNKSISGDADALTIQTRLFRDFFLQADYGTSINDRASGTGKLILKWYKSY